MKTKDAVMQRVLPLKAQAEVLSVKSIAADSGKHLQTSGGSCRVIEGVRGPRA